MPHIPDNENPHDVENLVENLIEIMLNDMSDKNKDKLLADLLYTAYSEDSVSFRQAWRTYMKSAMEE